MKKKDRWLPRRFPSKWKQKREWSIKEIVIFQKRLLLLRGIYRLRCTRGMMVPLANSLPAPKDSSASGAERPETAKHSIANARRLQPKIKENKN